MSEHCSKDHKAPLDRQGMQKLAITLGLVSLYFLAELIGGFWTGSLALLADAGHMFSDMSALGISLFAAWIVTRPPTSRKTFGYHRAEVLAACVNAATLFLVAGGILHEAWERLRSQQTEILAGPMLWIALGGLVINLISLKVLHGGHQHNLNLRGAWLHVLGDTLGSVGVVVAALLIWQFNWWWADPLASMAVCILILYSAWNLMKESLGILMENVPKDFEIDRVESFFHELPEVQSIHCLHVWQISSGINSFSCHVVMMPDCSSQFPLQQVCKQLQARFGLDHVTLQIERAEDPACDAANVDHCLILKHKEEVHSH